jgi:hypothetical protein
MTQNPETSTGSPDRSTTLPQSVPGKFSTHSSPEGEFKALMVDIYPQVYLDTRHEERIELSGNCYMTKNPATSTMLMGAELTTSFLTYEKRLLR